MAHIVVPYHISKSFIQAHPDWLFIYGKDVFGNGMFGQMWACDHEPNCFPVYTIQRYCPSNKRFFYDGSAEHLKLVDTCIDAIPLDGRPIIPLQGIGRGCSRMLELAPQLYAHMRKRLDDIMHKDIEWIYQ